MVYSLGTEMRKKCEKKRKLEGPKDQKGYRDTLGRTKQDSFPVAMPYMMRGAEEAENGTMGELAEE